MTWATVHSNHAIERVRFELIFSEPLTKKVIELAKKLFEVRRGDLRFNAIQDTQHIHIGPAPPTGPPPAGWSSVRLSPPNLIVEALQVHAESLVYESTDYRSWGTAKQRFQSVVMEILRAVSGVVDLSAVGLDYTDRFVFNGAPSSSSPVGLLDEQLISAIPEPAQRGELWHLHRGWFDVVEGNKYLMSQNLDAQDGHAPSGTTVRSLQLWTRVQWAPPTGGVEAADVDAHLEVLHTLCNAKFSQMLTPHARQMVGLT